MPVQYVVCKTNSQWVGHKANDEFSNQWFIVDYSQNNPTITKVAATVYKHQSGNTREDDNIY